MNGLTNKWINEWVGGWIYTLLDLFIDINLMSLRGIGIFKFIDWSRNPEVLYKDNFQSYEKEVGTAEEHKITLEVLSQVFR